MKLTPNDVEVLIHHSICVGAHPRFDAPKVKDSIEMFIRNGAMTVTGGASGPAVIATKKGHAWLDSICSTPPPAGEDNPLGEIDWAATARMAEGEFTPMGRDPIGIVEQAIEVAHLLPESDPMRVKILHACGKRLIFTLQYVGYLTSEEPPIGNIKDEDFMECSACSKLTGMPPLCPSCLHNREVISRLKRRDQWQYRNANSDGAWSEWHDYTPDILSIPFKSTNGGYREWREKTASQMEEK